MNKKKTTEIPIPMGTKKLMFFTEGEVVTERNLVNEREVLKGIIDQIHNDKNEVNIQLNNVERFTARNVAKLGINWDTEELSIGFYDNLEWIIPFYKLIRVLEPLKKKSNNQLKRKSKAGLLVDKNGSLKEDYPK